MPSQTHVSLSAPSLYPTKIDHRYYHKAFCFHLIVLIIHWFNGQPFKHSIRWFSCILKFIRYTKHMNQELHIVLWFIITNHKTLLGPNCTICILSQLAFRKGLKMRSKCRIAVRTFQARRRLNKEKRTFHDGKPTPKYSINVSWDAETIAATTINGSMTR